MFGSYSTGNETGKYDREDGRMNEEFHDLVTFVSDFFVSLLKRTKSESIVRSPLTPVLSVLFR